MCIPDQYRQESLSGWGKGRRGSLFTWKGLGVTWGPTEIGKNAARCKAKKALEPEIVWGTVQTSRTLAFSPCPLEVGLLC